MMHAAKKRRLDGPPAFQNKPFRSPLRKAAKDQMHAEQSQKAEAEHQLGANPGRIGTASDVPGLKPPLSSCVEASSANLEHRDTQKERSALSLQLTKLRQSLDTAQQALEIEASDQDAELRNLIAKWRAVAQEAAEELFTDAKQRVDGMGGVDAWRRRTNEDARLWNSNEDDRTPVRGEVGAQLTLWHRKQAGESVPSEPEYSENQEETEGVSLNRPRVLYPRLFRAH